MKQQTLNAPAGAKIVNVGIYCRLSKDDDIRNGESASIASQRTILEKHCKDSGWKVYDCYVDDGYSGTNFNRPNFERMLDDIDDDKINLVIVKDLSRLGRNYLLTGHYTEVYFPDRGVRFIALNDGIDTINSDNDIAPFKNILNELYSKDLSRKTRSAIRAKKQQGEFLSNYAPYGYKKDPADIHRLVIDENVALVVKRMFEMAKSGVGSVNIAKTLNEEKILTPLKYKQEVLGNWLNKTSKGIWLAETVISILRSRIYVGDNVQGVLECSRFKRTPNKRKPQSEWIITPNTHEGIVDTETWEIVQKRIDSRKRVIKHRHVQMFAGYVKCADCGGALSYAEGRGAENYTCGKYRRFGRLLCSSHYIRKDLLEQAVLNDIQKYAKLAKHQSAELANQLQTSSDDQMIKELKSMNVELKSQSKRYEELDGIISRLYEDNYSGKLSDERFAKLLTGYESEQTMIKARLEMLEKDIAEIESNTKDTKSWIQLIKNYSRIRKLDRDILSELIEKITVGEPRIVDGEKEYDITIYYRLVGAVG